jgi:hypothetical protein
MKNGKYILVKAPANYLGKKYRNKYVYEHILNYWTHYGILPKDDEIIHHKDENTHNNNIENLELIKRNIHSQEHIKQRGLTHVIICCPNCYKIFEKPKRQTFIIKKSNLTSCCSKKCAISLNSKMKDKELLKQIGKTSIVSIYHKKYKSKII